MEQATATAATLGRARFDKAALKQALSHGGELFIQFFLGEELVFPVPKFHIDSFKLLLASTVSRIALALPRGHAKTTLAKLAVVWYFLFSDYKFVVYISNTATVAAAACNDIINFLQGPNCRAVFGEIQWETERRGEGLYIFTINGKKCILRALGAGQQIRGLNIDNTRPQLAVVDDLEDDDNIATKVLFEKLRQWVYGPFMKALARNPKIIWLGNMLSTQSLLYSHCNSQLWHSMQFGCLLEDGTPLWPDLWPLERIRMDYAEYQTNNLVPRWMAEMMNQPVPGSAGLIDDSKIIYAPMRQPDEIEYGFITLDPAISQQRWADNTAIVAHGWVDDRWQVLDVVAGKFTIDVIWKECIEMAFRWGFRVIGLENVAYQASLQHIFQLYNEMHRLMEFEIIGLPAAGRKHERIKTWTSQLSSGLYCLTEGDFSVTQQLLMFNPQKKENEDDVIDACAYGPYMIANHFYQITANVGDNDAGQLKPRTGTDICVI